MMMTTGSNGVQRRAMMRSIVKGGRLVEEILLILRFDLGDDPKRAPLLVLGDASWSLDSQKKRGERGGRVRNAP